MRDFLRADTEILEMKVVVAHVLKYEFFQDLGVVADRTRGVAPQWKRQAIGSVRAFECGQHMCLRPEIVVTVPDVDSIHTKGGEQCTLPEAVDEILLLLLTRVGTSNDLIDEVTVGASTAFVGRFPGWKLEWCIHLF